MRPELSWLKSRKSLIFSSLVDFLIFNILFAITFKEYILNKSIFYFLSTSNSLIWIILSYIVGRYGLIISNKINLFLRNSIQSSLTIFFSLFLFLTQFRVFWNWDYMNFDSFSNFINFISNFYVKLFIFSNFFQIILSYFFSIKYVKKTHWLFLGTYERMKELEKFIGKKLNFEIQLYSPKSLNLNEYSGNGIIVDDESIAEEKNIQLIFTLKNKGLKIMKISNWCERYLNKYPSQLIKFNEIIGGQFSYDESSLRGRLKRIAETVISLSILIITLPLLITASLLIKLEDNGPIFYSQIRNGFGGKPFRIIKLRTMNIDAENDGEQWSKKDDKRITNIGRVLRKLRVDELPQLLLVINGQMSLIGPRPERPNIDKFLRQKIPNYDLRYSIKPGISGWAQVNYPYGASLDDSKYKLSYDLFYIKNFSIFLDIMILIQTIKIVFNAKGSKPN